MLLGGLIGWTAWMFLPRQYVAVSHFSVSIDYNRTGKLDHLEEDRLLGITEDILHSGAVMNEVFEKSSDEDYASFFSKTRTTRTNETWSLSIVGRDPEELGRLSLFWLDLAYDRLDEALSHAFLAEQYENALDGMTRCIQNGSAAVSPAGCPSDAEEMQQMIGTYADLIQSEKAASHGLSSAVILGEKDPGELEIRPASRSAALDTLLGAFCGFLLSFAAVWFPKNGNLK